MRHRHGSHNEALAPPALDQPWARTNSGEHRQVQALLPRAIDGDLIPRIRMPHDAGGGVVPEDAFEAAGGIVGAVGDDHHA